jgi:hypothetical protein
MNHINPFDLNILEKEKIRVFLPLLILPGSNTIQYKVFDVKYNGVYNLSQFFV